jgi:hypothetical protein
MTVIKYQRGVDKNKNYQQRQRESYKAFLDSFNDTHSANWAIIIKLLRIA